jgi:predicted hotdog family 3-hydroxylacyl-ACP dehydratase
MSDLEPNPLKAWPHDIQRLLPQEPPMLLLDEIVGWNDECIVAAVTVRPDSMFLGELGMPVHIAIEWMAQACGAWAGVRAIAKQQPVQIGFLLGTRNFKAHLSRFQVGDRVVVTATSVFNDGEMGVFDCQVDRGVERGVEREVEWGSELCATARLNVFQPDDLEAVLRQQGVTMPKHPAQP